MKLYRLHRKQNLPITIDEAWDLLSDPNNLKKLSPKEMSFDVLSGADRKTYAGQVIVYAVTPMLGIRTKWVTEITFVEDKHYFVDEQRFGPYAFWHHKHFIKEIPGGVEMEDIVDYKMPLGWLGQLVHPFLVAPKIESIFDYRRSTLESMYGVYTAPALNSTYNPQIKAPGPAQTRGGAHKHEILN